MVAYGGIVDAYVLHTVWYAQLQVNEMKGE